MRRKIAMDKVYDQLIFAQTKFPPFNSLHEGYVALLEEVDELWELVKTNPKSPFGPASLDIEIEATQVAAMAVRFLVDLCGQLDTEGWPSRKMKHEMEEEPMCKCGDDKYWYREMPGSVMCRKCGTIMAMEEREK